MADSAVVTGFLEKPNSKPDAVSRWRDGNGFKERIASAA
jgi:hypothetical protein